jgi:2-dehydropantoate 2-reductase
MHYLVFGAGAVGSLIGARLASSGSQVTFLTRPRLAHPFFENGIRLTGDTEPFLLQDPLIITSLDQTSDSDPVDVILLAVKSYDTEAAAQEIGSFPHEESAVVSLANGIGNESTLAGEIGHQRIIPASFTTAVQIQSSGAVHVERSRGLAISGSHALIPQIIADLRKSRIRVKHYPHALQMKWSKMLVNIVSNATSAIVGWSPDRVFRHKGLYRLEIEAMRETVRIMARKKMRPQNLPGVPIALLNPGIFLPPWLIQTPLRAIIAKGRGDKKPSFHYDIGRGQSEVAWLNGAIAKEGRELDVPAPANQLVFETLELLVRDSGMQDRFLDKPDELIRLAQAANVPGIRGYNPLGS